MIQRHSHGLKKLNAQPPAASAQGAAPPADRQAIERLLADYAEALSTCASAKYASLFTPDGAFTSVDFRGATHRRLYGKSATLVGRNKLVELVEAEEFCLDPQQRQACAAARRQDSAGFNNLTLEAVDGGVRGVLPLANGGRYDDVYVRTADGWKFKSRTVVMPAPGR